MGQKVNANGMRIGIIRTWPSLWFARKVKYRQWTLEDVRIRRLIQEKLVDAGITRIEIARTKKISVTIMTSKPGVVIGKQGAAIEELRKTLERTFGGPFEVNIREVRNPDAEAAVIAENIRAQIERRMPYRRAARMALEKAMQSGAIGIKVLVSGRLNGAEIARVETFKEGNVPLHTFRANIEFAKDVAVTTYGTIGVQVWIYKGMVFKNIQQVHSSDLAA